MAAKVYIKAQYTADNLGNRWNNSTTEIVLSPNDTPVTGLWDTTRGSDVDSTGGSDNAVYLWMYSILFLKTEKDGSSNIVRTPITLFGISDLIVGAKGKGIFFFRNTGIPITWEIVKIK